MRKGVYAASFDPITNGHLWCIEQGVKIFDQLVVAIGVNPEKKIYFSPQGKNQISPKEQPDNTPTW